MRQKLDIETKTITLTIGISDYQKLTKLAKKLNMSRSQYVRFCVNNDYQEVFNESNETAQKLINLLSDFNKQANAILSNK